MRAADTKRQRATAAAVETHCGTNEFQITKSPALPPTRLATKSPPSSRPPVIGGASIVPNFGLEQLLWLGVSFNQIYELNLEELLCCPNL
eukprot:SAG22_NODE_4714_length_1182_cov_3.371191_3_plen_89_part_01